MAEIKFKPVSNYILIEPMETPDTTPSGLLLPEQAKDKPNQGTVVATGDGQRNYEGTEIPVCVKVGDTVLFPKFAGTDLKLGPKTYRIMRDVDLFGIIR